MSMVNMMQNTDSNILRQSFLIPNPYRWLGINRFQPTEPDNDPVTEEEMVSVRISLSQLERGDYSEVCAGSDESELQRMLDRWKE